MWVFELHAFMCTICVWYLSRSNLKRASGSLELQVQMVVNNTMRTKPGSSSRPTNALNCWTASLASTCIFFQTMAITWSFVGLPWIVCNIFVCVCVVCLILKVLWKIARFEATYRILYNITENDEVGRELLWVLTFSCLTKHNIFLSIHKTKLAWALRGLDW